MKIGWAQRASILPWGRVIDGDQGGSLAVNRNRRP